jgi:hypothetical protein
MNIAARYVLDYADDAATLSRILPADTAVGDVARASRAAFEAFMAGGETWGKRELARWLVEAYRPATGFADEEGEPSDVAPVSTARARSVVTDETVRRIVGAARRTLALDPAPGALVAQAKERAWIVPVCDAAGGRGYAPRTFGALTLAERLLSLLVVGYLLREDASFEEPPPRSGVRPRGPTVA